MKNSTTIESKLEAFISRYYKNELLRGLLFFVAIGASYFLLVLLIEYFLWLNPAGRAILFWSFIAVEGILLYRFVFLPLARLFKLSRGIDFNYASILIGSHFPEVRDKLINTLQLKSQPNPSDLALASIAQKARELEPIPFSLAIDYKRNLRFFKYALIPLLLFLVLNFTGENIFSSSYERVVNYKTAYQAPAPFRFFIISEKLQAIENEDFTVRVKTEGTQIPEIVQIQVDGNSFFMKSDGPGSFYYTVNSITSPVTFSFTANGIVSRDYKLDVIKTPLIIDFKIDLEYPVYTGKTHQTVENTGSIIIPEGTKVRWKLSTLETDRVEWIGTDSTYLFRYSKGDKKNGYEYSNNFFLDTRYSIATSNAALNRYENLDYTIEVVRDLPPEIDVETKKDTVTGFQNYHRGVVTDDYGLRSLKLVYFIDNQIDNNKSVIIDIGSGTVDQFIAAFPGDYDLEEGKSYNYYFEVRDNDELNGFKVSRSSVFSFRTATTDEKERLQLEEQGRTINDLNKVLKNKEDQRAELEHLQRIQKEKSQLSFSEQQRIKSFIEKQKEQDQMMERFAEKLRKNLKEFDRLEPDQSKENELLQNRLAENEERLKEQEKLMEELSKLQEKLSKEELGKRLDKLAMENKNSKRSMEQLLELTKRFYIQTKMERIARDIEDLGKEQEKLGITEQPDELGQQQEIIDEFQKLEEDLSELKRESESLKNPIEIPEDISLQEAIKTDQETALKELQKDSKDPSSQNTDNNSSKQNASSKQRDAGKNMQKLGKKMRFELAGQGGEQLQEDVSMLRQILDNLILFSFNEEHLMMKFRKMDNRNPEFSRLLVRQSNLRENYRHIDDSLFALSLRNPGLEEEINEQLLNIEYSLDQSLDRLADNKIDQGTASVQYVVTGANHLADMLSEILGNMQEQLSMANGSGSGGVPMPGQGGKGGGRQLSDIIMSQQELSKEMGKGENDQGKKGRKDNSTEGESGEGGIGNKEGNEAGEEVSEMERALQFEIYKKQQGLRRALEDLIRRGDLGGESNELLKEMEEIEDRLLSGGLDQEVARRMNEISHQLMKLQTAELEQGRDKERESFSNDKEYQNPAGKYIPAARDYFNIKELFNREVLPLSLPFKKKVQAYYKKVK